MQRRSSRVAGSGSEQGWEASVPSASIAEAEDAQAQESLLAYAWASKREPFSWQNPFNMFNLRNGWGHSIAANLVAMLSGPWIRKSMLAIMPDEAVYERMVLAWQSMQLVGSLFGIYMLEQALTTEVEDEGWRDVVCRTCFVLGALNFLMPVFLIAVLMTTLQTVPRSQQRRFLERHAWWIMLPGRTMVLASQFVLVAGGLRLWRIYAAASTSAAVPGGRKLAVPLAAWVLTFLVWVRLINKAVEFNQQQAKPWDAVVATAELPARHLARDDVIGLLEHFVRECSVGTCEDVDATSAVNPGSRSCYGDVSLASFRMHVVQLRTARACTPGEAAKLVRLSELTHKLIGVVWTIFEKAYLDNIGRAGFGTPEEVFQSAFAAELSENPPRKVA